MGEIEKQSDELTVLIMEMIDERLEKFLNDNSDKYTENMRGVIWTIGISAISSSLVYVLCKIITDCNEDKKLDEQEMIEFADAAVRSAIDAVLHQYTNINNQKITIKQPKDQN